MRRSMAICVLVVLSFPGSVGAQCSGNGGAGQLTVGLQRLGSVVETRVDGSPGAFFAVFASGGISTLFVPNLGLVCIDVTSPIFYEALGGNLSAGGSFSSFFAVPDTPAWENITYWLQGIVADPAQPSGFALTAAVRKDYEPANSRTAVGPLLFARAWPRATVFAETNDVLVSGGSTSGDWETATPLDRMEIYSPIARAFFPAATMSVARVHHTQTRLLDGRILIAGGGTAANGSATNTCQIFDPETYVLAAAGPMSQARLGHEAVLLDDGRVLVMGGTTVLGAEGNGAPSPIWAGALATAEIYDPTTNLWTLAQNLMSSGRIDFQATKLLDGRVLVMSGISGSRATGPREATLTCDLFDPVTNAFTPTASWPAATYARYGFRATRLPSGNVVVTGGLSAFDPVSGTPAGLSGLNTALVYVTAAAAWIVGPGVPGGELRDHQAVLLQDGRLMVTGGRRNSGLPVSSSRVFDPATATWSSLPALLGSRHGHATVVANDGSVVTLGGQVNVVGGTLGNTELFTP